MTSWIDKIPPVDWALALAAVVALLTSLVLRRRGGRFRSLPGWAGFWLAFAGILLSLSRVYRWISFPLLAALMFAALRAYFTEAPLRGKDRYAILAAYIAIPFALYPAYIRSDEAFLATVPVALFLVIPFLIALGKSVEGLLDSMGRTLLGVLLFVFCAAHLALLVDQPGGVLELFGVIVLASELPQRVAGRLWVGAEWLRPAAGLALGAILAVGLGWVLGPTCGLGAQDSAWAGFLVFVAVTLGGRVSHAMSHDLTAESPVRGTRGLFLDRTVPVVYAAPVFFHYLNYFA